MENNMLIIPGKFVPSNDTVTLLTYKRLKHLNMNLDVFALKGKEDNGLVKELKIDSHFSKFNIEYYCDYEKTITINKPYLLPLGLINMIRYCFASIKKFEKKNYRYLYTSCIPGISHICGYEIKRKHPNVQWYASFSDPIKGAPYKKDPNLKRRSIFYKIAFKVGSFVYMNNKYEEVAIKKADKLIFICPEQRDFTVSQYQEHKESILERSIILPLCYDENWDMFNELIDNIKVKNKPKIAVHLGRLYGLRRADVFLEALKELKDKDNLLSNKIVFHQYSEIQKEDIKYIKDNKLEDVFVIHDKVSYDKSLETMKNADILVLFDTLMKNEPIQPYLPSKIVEYLLLKKPILGICGKNSPSYRILNQYGFKYNGCDKETIKRNIISIINDNENYDYSLDELKSINNCLKIEV